MLNDKIIKEIRAKGPISIEQFMTRALFDKKEGYYTTKHVFGRKGDFITAPEICQVFGEMIAVLIASTIAAWRENQQDRKVQLVELGPGRGTLMHDMLRTMQFMPEHARPDAVHMVEASVHLQDQQVHILAPFISRGEEGYITWHRALETLPDMPAIVIANEFFDALPIRQFVWKQGAWHERMVGEEAGTLIWQDVSVEKLPPAISLPADPEEGSMLEYSPHAADAMQALTRRLSAHGGMAIVIDYGYKEYAYGDSLQAVKKHQYANVLADIGEVDITAHVNFGMLRDIALDQGLQLRALISQGQFLTQLGAEMRLSALCQNAEPGQIIDLISGLRRLTAPDQMGLLFKVLIVASADVPVVHQFT